MSESHLPPARFEPSDVTFPALAIGLLGTLAAVFLCTLLAMWLYPSAIVDQRLRHPLPVYPEPRLQSDPQADLRKFLAGELARLNSVGWVDQQRQIAHVPIDDAMRAVAQRGIPDWPSQDAKQ